MTEPRSDKRLDVERAEGGNRGAEGRLWPGGGLERPPALIPGTHSGVGQRPDVIGPDGVGPVLAGHPGPHGVAGQDPSPRWTTERLTDLQNGDGFVLVTHSGRCTMVKARCSARS